jgi:hypothetical protein
MRAVIRAAGRARGVVLPPATRITGADGKVMELNPRPVDAAVERPVGETLTGKDT